jgi:Domain of unknown function (DUF1929)/IPT/TIG domain/S-layer homology domain
MAPHGHGPRDENSGNPPDATHPRGRSPSSGMDMGAPGSAESMSGHEHERVVPPDPVPGDPDPRELEAVGGGKHPAFRRDGSEWRRLRTVENPSPEGSFGYAGPFVELTPEDLRDGAGTLVFPLDPHRAADVAVETVRAFRRTESGEWEIAPRAALGITREYVWARVRRPGVYGPIGLPTDALVARALALLSVVRPWKEIWGEDLARELFEKTCASLLCDHRVRERLTDPRRHRTLVEDNLRLGLPARWLADGRLAPLSDDADAPCRVARALERRLATRSRRARAPDPPETAMLAMTTGTPGQVGQWDLVTPVPSTADMVLAVHAALLRDGTVLYFGGSENVGAQNVEGGSAIDRTRRWNPQTGAIDVLSSPWRHDLFCCGHAFLPDGRLLAAGGTRSWGGVEHTGHGTNFEGLRTVSVFDPGAPAGANPWRSVVRLCPERGQTRGGGAWYPTLAALADGRVVKMTGNPEFEDSHHNNRMVEVFDPATGRWADQGAAADLPIGDAAELPLYPRLHLFPDGRVFCATPMEGPPGGPGWESWFWSPATKTWSSAGSGPGGGFVGFDTSAILLPLRHAENYRARVLYLNRPDAKIIDFGAAAPAWQNTSPRALSDPIAGAPIRYHATGVLLADGTVMLIGGHSDPMNWNPPQLTAEGYDPATDTWSVLATATVPRVYHSVALLLPDGRVWTAGSDYGNGDHEPRMEIYSPPYLFRGPRPTITSAPATITYGAPFSVETPDAASIAAVALVRCGTATHAFGIDQRWLDLGILGAAGGRLTVAAPPNRNVAPPGYYMLFLLDPSGVPSVARILRVQASMAPTIAAVYPRSGSSAGGSAITITGTNFRPAATVTIGGASATAVVVVSETCITAITPALAPGALYDVRVAHPDLSNRTLADGWLADFLDVPQAHLFHEAVERLFRGGVTAGCGGGNFCPDDTVTRAQMAMFLMRAEHGEGYVAPAATGTVFTDVPSAALGAGAIEQAASEGIFAAGGSFGPNDAVTRAEMAELLIKAEHGPAYVPPAATGKFADVPAAAPSAAWIERLAAEGITAGCGGGNFCPDDTSTRGQMAVFLVKTFGLP